MRKILFLNIPNLGKEDRESCLELCSRCTPLVEPLENGGLYLDLSGCGDALKIIHDIGQTLPESVQAGLATSRLVARIAGQCRDLHIFPVYSFRLFPRGKITVVEVLPGQERNFISPLPLDSFYPLPPRTVKKFSRLGLATVGELAGLSTGQLAQLLGQPDPLLHLQLTGVDASPVAGLYPPFRITYPLETGEEEWDYIQVEQTLVNAASELSCLLAQRHLGCQRIRLETRLKQQSFEKERRLGSPCQEAGQLANILLNLLQMPAALPLAFIITLDELAPLQLCQPALFIPRVFYAAQERKIRMENLVQDLYQRFPGALQQGLPIEHREQVLALWDPWRRPPGSSLQ